MTAEPARPPAPAAPATRRVRGVDAARGTALIGMMSVHIMPPSTDGRVSLAYLVSSGRAAALFAVLAGVGIALACGGSTPPGGQELAAARRAIAARAGVIFVIGLVLGAIPNPVAVILPYYGVLFLAALPVLGWPARRLGGGCGGVGAARTRGQPPAACPAGLPSRRQPHRGRPVRAGAVRSGPCC